MLLSSGIGFDYKKNRSLQKKIIFHFRIPLPYGPHEEITPNVPEDITGSFLRSPRCLKNLTLESPRDAAGHSPVKQNAPHTYGEACSHKP
jgi:hypothetical protein